MDLIQRAVCLKAAFYVNLIAITLSMLFVNKKFLHVATTAENFVIGEEWE
jgi:hypothetical protein